MLCAVIFLVVVAAASCSLEFSTAGPVTGNLARDQEDRPPLVGTDQLGRDVLDPYPRQGRVSLFAGTVVGIALIVSVPLGLLRAIRAGGGIAARWRLRVVMSASSLPSPRRQSGRDCHRWLQSGSCSRCGCCG